MEDVWQMILLSMMVIFILVKQYRKEVDKQQKKLSGPAGGEELPEPVWAEPAAYAAPEEAPLAQQESGVPHARKKKKGQAASATVQHSMPPLSADEADASSEYDIRSAEEARRAIVWGEVLQRKYC